MGFGSQLPRLSNYLGIMMTVVEQNPWKRIPAGIYFATELQALKQLDIYAALPRWQGHEMKVIQGVHGQYYIAARRVVDEGCE